MNKMALLVGAAIAAGVAQAAFTWDLNFVLEKADAPLTLDNAYAGMVCSNMTLHGDMTINFEKYGTSLYVYPLADDGVTPIEGVSKISIGPDIGDDVTLSVRNATLNAHSSRAGGVLSGQLRADLIIGENGGNGRLWQNADPSHTWQYGPVQVRTIQLAEKATTTEDVFEVSRVGYNSSLGFRTVYNYNEKPLRISFVNNENTTPYSGYLMPYAGYRAFACAKGDIILHGQPKTPIWIKTWSGWNFWLTETDAKMAGYLRTEGDCDTIIATGNHDTTIDGTHVIWGHTGDLIFTPSDKSYKDGYAQVKVDDVLPHGIGTGNVTVRSLPDTGALLPFDLNGHSQRVNGLLLENDAFLRNTGDQPLEIVFGDGDASGRASGSLTNATISFVKTGTGTLTLSNAVFTTLVVTNGTVDLYPGTVNRIGTLAMTNAVLKLNAGALLEVENWQLADDVTSVVALPSSGMTNEMVTVYSRCPGAPFVKDGPNYVTAMTPSDALGMPLRVNGGVLRMGGAVCTNEFWRFIAKRAKNDGYTYDISLLDGSVCKVYVPVGLGTIGLFSPEGLASQGNAFAGVSDCPGDQLLPKQVCATAGYISGWNVNYITNNFNSDVKSDPILTGGTSGPAVHFVNMHDSWITDNKFDDVSQKNGWIPNWSGGILYTNNFERLDPDVPATWKTVTWRRTTGCKDPASYCLRRIVNNDRINVTDWELQSSPTGADGTWATMDVRSNQAYGTSTGTTLDSQFYYTYNGHVPYLFNALNAGWKFDTFGAVSVAKGAKLVLDDIPDVNVAFNALEVDLTAGAGTITKFRPAANGTLFLKNPRPADLKGGSLTNAIVLPLTLGSILDAANLDTWTVYVDGELSKESQVKVIDGKLVVKTPHGMMFLLK